VDSGNPLSVVKLGNDFILASASRLRGRKGRTVSVSPQTAAALVILLVEDEFFVRIDIADFLREAGYVVVEAQTGEEAIAVFDSGMSIDAVFTDINLTGRVSGWDVAERCRADQPNIPVLYTSGKTIEPDRQVPGSVFLSKPYQRGDVLIACERLLSK
jgi:CheY-like chemotaxis protein